MPAVVIGVFLLDDHEVVRTGLRALLEACDDIDVVGEADTVAEALIRIPEVQPDVAILDVRLPDGTGVEVCRDVRSTSPDIACVMLTSYADDEALIASILAGAAGYVLKQVGSLDLLDTIRRAGSGESLLDPALTDRVLNVISGFSSIRCTRIANRLANQVRRRAPHPGGNGRIRWSLHI